MVPGIPSPSSPLWPPYPETINTSTRLSFRRPLFILSVFLAGVFVGPMIAPVCQPTFDSAWLRAPWLPRAAPTHALGRPHPHAASAAARLAHPSSHDAEHETEEWRTLQEKWWPLAGRKALPQLFDAKEAQRFLDLRRDINAEMAHLLNTAEASPRAADYSPFRLAVQLLNSVEGTVDTFLRDAFAHGPHRGAAWPLDPRVEVAETREELRVTCTLKGLRKDMVNIELRGPELWVSIREAQRGEDFEMAAQVERVFLLPPNVQPEDVRATLDGSDLRIVVRKVQSDPPARTPIDIPISSA